MPLPDNCRFCRIRDGGTASQIDVPFLESRAYMSIASIGAFIEGWTLVIPLEHCLSLREHYNSPEFIKFRQDAVDHVSAEYGPCIMFEHGPNHCGSLTGCGTDHAHLHIVPAQFPIEQVLQDSGISNWTRAYASEISQLAEGSEYLFFSTTPADRDPLGFFKLVTEPSSQFFRKAIASKIGKGDVANYREYPHVDLSLRTSKRLTKTAAVA